MRDLPPIPGIDFSTAQIKSLSHLLEPGMMESLIVAGRTPIEYGYTTGDWRRPVYKDGRLEARTIWHRYVIVPPPGTTRNSRLGMFGIGNFYFHDEEGNQLPPPQTLHLNQYGTKLFRKRSDEALQAVPLSLGPQGRNTLVNRFIERLGF